MNKIKGLMLLSSLSMVAAGAHAAEFSFWGGKVSTKSDSIPYVYDSNTGNVIDSDLGKGSAYGLDFSGEVIGLTLGAAYSYSDAVASNGFDSNPASPNDCNVNPVQGVISDCYDNATIHTDTSAANFDLTVGKAFNLGGLMLTPYGGVRKFNFTQVMNGAYNYPGGFETTWQRNSEFSDLGPRVGVKLGIPVGSFSFDADASYATFSGKRTEAVNETETVNGAFNRTAYLADSQTIKPKTIELMVSAGYKVTSNTTISVGYRYQKTTKVIDNRESNSGNNLPATYSQVSEGDLTMKGVFAKAKFDF